MPTGAPQPCPLVPANQQTGTPHGSQAPTACSIPTVNDWCETWASSPYDGTGHRADSPGNYFGSRIIGVSTDGRTAFIAGTSDQASSGSSDYQAVTIAYDTATGVSRWVSVFNAPPGVQTYAQALSAGGSRVFVTAVASSGQDPVVAYDAASGRQLWSALFDGGAADAETSVASPDGSALYVTGSDGNHAVTTAYDGATGVALWTALDSGPVGTSVTGDGVAVTGGRVYTTATVYSQSAVSAIDVFTIDAASGLTMVTGSRAATGGSGAGLAVTPDGSRAFAPYQDCAPDLSFCYMAVIGFDTTTGHALWQSDYKGALGDGSGAVWPWGPVAISPDGTQVYVAGPTCDSIEGAAGCGFTTVAYRTATGAQLWASAYNGTTPFLTFGAGPTVAVNPVSGEVYTTGVAQGGAFVTRAYAASSGAVTHTALFTDYPSNQSVGVAVTPDGSRVIVAAVSETSVNPANNDIVAVAYATSFAPSTSVPESPVAPALMLAAAVAGLVSARVTRHRRKRCALRDRSS
jgi:hypothetical protein